MQVKKRALLGQLSDMDLRLLRVFKAVVDCGGMSAAELELNISLSTISKHIKDLEQRLGLTLCQRGREGFAVTDEGLLIYQETVNLLAATEAFRRGVDEVHQRMGGQLHVAIFDHTVSNPQAQIGRAIALFSERAPEVSLQMYVEPINTIERGVIDGQFQVGVIPMHRSAESLSYHSLFSERMFLYCGAQHELFSGPHETLIGICSQLCLRRIRLSFAEYGTEPAATFASQGDGVCAGVDSDVNSVRQIRRLSAGSLRGVFCGAEPDAGNQTGAVPLSLRILQRAAPLAGAATGGEAVP